METYQLSIGAIVALLILKEVFGFVRSNRNGREPHAGDMSVDYWKAQNREALEETIAPLLKDLKETNEGIERGIDRLTTVIDERLPKMK